MMRMEHKGYFAKIMEAPRLVGDQIFGLPPGTPLPVYQADAFKKYPENWMKGPGVFVVPVNPNKGLWFDWRDNDENNTAIIPTVKGCNPITGLQTTGFFLERYDMKCPKHGCDFQAERFCPECGYNWPDRGYVSGSPLWWDGFMADGCIRQFFFTEEMMRDVATHMIGKENTVPAFGFAFYSPKERRAPQVNTYIYKTSLPMFNYLTMPMAKSYDYSASGHNVKGTLTSFGGEVKSKGTLSILQKRYRGGGSALSHSPISDGGMDSAPQAALYSAVSEGTSFMGQDRGITLDCLSAPAEVAGASVEVRARESYTPQKEVAVGAGAKIRQELPKDAYSLDSWNDKPDAVMTVYFVFQEEFNKMAEGGFNDFKDCKDGMLAGLPVG